MITGANGQLGRDLVRECARRGIAVAASDLPRLDICDLAAVREALAAERPDALVNCSAYNAVDRAESDFEQARLVNAAGPGNLALAAEESGIPLMHFSTDFVFDGEKGEPYTIDDQPHPVNRYGESKLLGERAVAKACGRAFVVRLSWVFGSGNVNFVKKILHWAAGRDVLRVVDDQISRPAYTVDLAPLILDLLDSRAFGLYHLANSGICSRYEWACRIVRLSGLSTKVEQAKSAEFETAARRPRFSALDLSSIEAVLGRRPPDWKDATKRFLTEIGADE